MRTRKENIDRQIDSIGEEIGKKQSEIETLKDQVIAHKKQKEILSKKINVSDQNRAVDNEATRLIHTIQKFLIRFKEEKKKALVYLDMMIKKLTIVFFPWANAKCLHLHF